MFSLLRFIGGVMIVTSFFGPQNLHTEMMEVKGILFILIGNTEELLWRQFKKEQN
jgi:hypothetical protein